MTYRILSVHQNVYDLWERRGGFVCLHFTAREIVTSAGQENGNYETRHFTIGRASKQQKFGNSRWGSFIDAKLMCPYAYVRIRSQSHQFIVTVKARVWVTVKTQRLAQRSFAFLGEAFQVMRPSSVHYINWIWIIEVLLLLLSILVKDMGHTIG